MIARLAGTAVLATFLLLAGAAGWSSDQRVAGACGSPTWQLVVDPEQSRPLAPHLVLHAQGLAVPAQGRFEWGNGRFGVAAIDTPDGSGTLVSLQPVYDEPGAYRLKLHIVDACGANWELDYEVAVPLVLPSPTRISCPAPLDTDGVCVVSADVEHSFGLDGPADGEDAWRWTSGEIEGRPTAGAADRYRVTLAAGQSIHLQATRRTDAGWLVTPPMIVVARVPQHAPISFYVDPGRVTADEEVTIGFTAPPDATDAQPAILVDGRRVAAAESTSVRLDAGDHEVAYELRHADGQLVRRQIIITAREAVPLVAWIALAVSIAALVAFAAWRIGKRRHAASRRAPRATEPAVPRRPVRLSSAWPAEDMRNRITAAPVAPHGCKLGCICAAQGSVYE